MPPKSLAASPVELLPLQTTLTGSVAGLGQQQRDHVAEAELVLAGDHGRHDRRAALCGGQRQVDVALAEEALLLAEVDGRDVDDRDDADVDLVRLAAAPPGPRCVVGVVTAGGGGAASATAVRSASEAARHRELHPPEGVSRGECSDSRTHVLRVNLELSRTLGSQCLAIVDAHGVRFLGSGGRTSVRIANRLGAAWPNSRPSPRPSPSWSATATPSRWRASPTSSRSPPARRSSGRAGATSRWCG